MRLKTKKRYNRKKTYKRHNHKRRVQTKKRCHRGGGPENSYVDFMDSGGIHVRYNENDPDKMWLIGPSSRLWTFRTLSEGVGMRGKNGRYKPFIDAWNKDAKDHGTAITLSDFLYPKDDVNSSYGMVISDAQFRRIFSKPPAIARYPGLYDASVVAKNRALRLQTVDLDDDVVMIGDDFKQPHPPLSALALPAPAQPEVLQTNLKLLTDVVKKMGYQLDEETLTQILINNDNNVGNAAIEIWEQHEQPPQSAVVASP
jgi:hypothetical protein